MSSIRTFLWFSFCHALPVSIVLDILRWSIIIRITTMKFPHKVIHNLRCVLLLFRVTFPFLLLCYWRMLFFRLFFKIFSFISVKFHFILSAINNLRHFILLILGSFFQTARYWYLLKFFCLAKLLKHKRLRFLPLFLLLANAFNKVSK